jgi:energy-coupling factor transporter ATP-binding protein EcfA2
MTATIGAGLQIHGWPFTAVNGERHSVDLCLEQGAHGAIVGCTGAGKTRAALHLLGVVPGEDLDVRLDGEPITRYDVSHFSLVPSDPYLMFSLIGTTVAEELQLTFVFGGRSPDAVAIDTVATALSLSHLMARAPWTLSGGEAMRVAVALAILRSPRVLVLDDIWDAMDVDAGPALAAYISRWRRETNGIVLELRRGPSTAPMGLVRVIGHPPSAGGQTRTTAAIPALPGTVDGAFRVAGLTCAYPTNPSFSLGPIDGCIHAGESIGLVGANGAGKTTCLRAIAGVSRPTGGVVTIQATDLRPSTPLAARARYTQYVFQNPDHQISLPTVERELSAAATYLGVSAEAVDVVADLLGIGDLMSESPLEQPRSVRRLMTIGSAFTSGVPVVLLDEPTTGLDCEQARRVGALVRAHCKRGGSVLFVSHDAAFVRDNATTTWRMSDGKLFALRG